MEKGEELELQDAWPAYQPASTPSVDVVRIAALVNDKFRERLPAWQIIVDRPEHFAQFFSDVLRLALDEQLSFAHQTELITFLGNCFNSLEVELLCQEAGKLCALPIWINLLPSQRSHLLEHNLKMKKYWAKLEQKLAKLPAEELEKVEFNRRFLWRLLQRFKSVVDFIDDESKEVDIEAVGYCERLISLFIDLSAQLTTRRFFNALLLSSQAITHCLLSQFIRTEHGSLFCELITMLKFYARFEIDDVSGQQLTAAEVIKRHYNSISSLQEATPNVMYRLGIVVS